MEDNSKDFWCYIILALIGGFIGLQEFYVRKYVAGIFAVLFCWTCIPAIVAFVEAIYWLFLGKNEFNKEFNRLNFIPNKGKILLED